MKHLLRLNEYVEAMEKPMVKKALNTPMTAEMMLKKIAQRFNKLIGKKSNESLDDNLGLSDDFMQNLKGQFEPEDVEGAMRDSRDILQLLSSIRQAEADMSEADKKEKAMEIVLDIFKGKGFDVEKIDFKLDILNDSDLMDAKSNIIGVEPERFKEVKKEIEEENPKLKKELDIRAIQNALTQGFATSIKDDFVTGDTEIEGVSFGDYYNLMNKTFGLYSKVPKALMHQVMTQSPALGRVELVWNEDKNKYTIEASGYTILILVHEMIKGILELISMHRDPGLEAEDEEKLMSLSGTQFSEREGLQYGPGMVDKFKEFFLKVEDNLLRDREIRERNPAMMLNVLSRFYKLEDDLFLRACKAIFSDDENKPYELFEDFYLDGLEGTGFRRSDDGEGPTGPGGGGPSSGPTPPSDDALRDLLSGAGISLNQDPNMSESFKYVMAFNIFNILESKKDILDRWSRTEDRAEVVKYMDRYQRLVANPKGELKDLLVQDIPGVNVEANLNDRRNIEKYDYNSLRNLVNHIIKRIKTPTVSSLKPGDINAAILTIQRAMNLPQTGFYGKDLEDKVKFFQQDFKELFSSDYDWRAIKTKLDDVGLSNLKPIEKIQLAKSAEFISSTEELIAQKETDLEEKVREVAEEQDEAKKKQLENKIIAEYNKLSDIKKTLKDIKTVLSGGIENPSGKLDPSTIGALMYAKGIDKLEGLSSLGTLRPSGGEIIEDNENYRVYRILSSKFCVEARKGFERVLTQMGVGDKVYNWCISWDQTESFYRTHRVTAPRKQTIYFIENKKRAEYEYQKWAEFKQSGGNVFAPGMNRSDSYLDWRMANGSPRMSRENVEKIDRESNRKFYDNYHISVIFVQETPDGNKYWLVGASNNGQWGDNRPFDFEKIFKIMYPSNEQESIRDDRGNTSGGGGQVHPSVQVPQEIIDQPFYHIPDQAEKDKLIELLAPMDLSSIERGTVSSVERMITNKNLTASQVEELSYEDKETWLSNSFFGEIEINNFLDNRNAKGIKPDVWKILPDPLKSLYITRTVGATLSQEMVDDIKDKPKLFKAYQDFIKRRLVGEGGSGGIIDKMGEATTLKELKNNALPDHDLKLISKPYDFNKIKKEYKELRKQIDELPVDTKVSRRTSLMKELKSKEIKIDQYMNIIARYRDSLKQAIDNVRRNDQASILRNNTNMKEFKQMSYGIELSKILQAANALLDIRTSKTDDKGNKLRMFADIIEKDPGIDKLSTDWQSVPNPFNKMIKLRAKDQQKANALISKMVSMLLTRSEGIPTKGTDFGKNYVNSIENVFNYIKGLDSNHLDLINLFLKRAMVYYKFNEMTKPENMNGSDAKRAYKHYDSVLTKFPDLTNPRTYKWKKSDSFSRSNRESTRLGETRPGHTEELG